MFGILLSAFFSVLGWVVRSVMVKFVVFFALWFVTTEFIEVLVNYLPNSWALESFFYQIPSEIWYVLNLFQFSAGLSAVVSALALRFMIRRIPIIG